MKDININGVFVSNMISSRGNPVANQKVIMFDLINTTYFQSYNTVIARIEREGNYLKTTLDKSWNDPKRGASKTTSKYLARFLMEPRKTTIDKIRNGVYRIENLNEKG